MRRIALVALLGACLAGCGWRIQVQSDTQWSGFVNQGEVSGRGYATYDLWSTAPGFAFTKETEGGYLRVKFVKGRGDEPRTDAPYGAVWGQGY